MKVQPDHIFIIGTHRSATTSMFRYLSQHHKITPSLKKELHYFTPGIYSGSHHLDKTAYYDLFPKRPGIRMEASPSYLYGGEKLAQLLNSEFKEPRFLLILRDPVERFFSFYKHYCIRLKPQKRVAIEEFFARSKSEYESGIVKDTLLNRGLREGVYVSHLKAWIEQCGERLKIIDFNDIQENSRLVVDDTLNFLELPPLKPEQKKLPQHNETREGKSYRVHNFAMMINRSLEVFFNQNGGIKEGIKKVYGAMNEKEFLVKFSPEIVKEVENFYRPHNERLGTLMNEYQLKKKPGWAT